MLSTCLLSRFVEFHSRQEVENFSANQRHGGHPDFPISRKNRNLVEGVAILPPAKFRWIPFSGCRGVENVSVNQRLGWQSWFSIFRDVNFGYMCPKTLTLEIWPWSSSWITLGSWWILWNNIQISHSSKLLWPRLKFWLRMHCYLDL